MKKIMGFIVVLLLAGIGTIRAQNIFPATGNVGIGTTTPANKLEVKGGWIYTDGSIQVDGGDVFISRVNTPYGYVCRPNTPGYKNLQFAVTGGGPLENLALNSNISYFTGTVGIGTTAPTHQLDVRGDIYTNGMLYVDGGDVFIARVNNPYGYVIRPDQDGYRNLAFAVVGGKSLDNVQVLANLTQFSGNVGIGTSNPGSNKLAVEGTIAARKVIVTLSNPFPDYVFEPGYELPSLKSVEKYINANGRLQGLPSADSVAQGGLDLGNTQAKLLEKIEQLTLYTIDLQKQVEDLKKQAEQLRAGNEKFASLQQQIDKLKKKKH